MKAGRGCYGWGLSGLSDLSDFGDFESIFQAIRPRNVISIPQHIWKQ
jgi:hypothetical protein